MILKGQISTKHSQAILEELFKRVELEYSPEFTAQPEWYLKKTWTEEEQEDFRVWLGKQLTKWGYCKGKYRGQDHGYYESSKLVANYGWRTSQS